MEKNLDSKGRWRNKIVAFRVSPEEAEQIDACVRLSGLSKQDYITKRLTDREIVVQGNPRVYKALRNQMAEIYEELKHLEKCSEENEELLSTLRLVAETLYPVLEKIKELVTETTPEWAGTATELVEVLQVEMQPNALSRKLNVSLERLILEYGIQYKAERGHDGRKIRLAFVGNQV